MSLFLWGQYPRSESLVKNTRDWDRGRISKESLDQKFLEEREALLSLQKGWPYLSTGQFHWDDLIRPYASLTPSINVGFLKRFFETNTFWRVLDCDEDLTLQKGTIEKWLKAHYFLPPFSSRDSLVFTFPFLFLLRNFIQGATDFPFLPQIAHHLPKGMIVFVEPFLGQKKLTKEEKENAFHFLKRIKEKTKLPIALVTCFYSIQKEQEFLYQLPLDGIGIDFYHNSLESIGSGFPPERFLIAGILDTASTRLEKEEHVKKFLEQASKVVSSDRLFLAPNAPAELLPRQVMDAKINHLKKILT